MENKVYSLVLPITLSTFRGPLHLMILHKEKDGGSRAALTAFSCHIAPFRYEFS